MGWAESPLGRKIAAAASIWFASLFTVSKKASVETAAAVDSVSAKANASASLATSAAVISDSLLSEVASLRWRVMVLEGAAGKGKLAEARESIVRPHARKKPRSWWPWG